MERVVYRMETAPHLCDKSSPCGKYSSYVTAYIYCERQTYFMRVVGHEGKETKQNKLWRLGLELVAFIFLLSLIGLDRY